MAGGATRTAGRCGCALCICLTWVIDRGLPALLRIAACRLSKLGGGAGGATRATTARFATFAGGGAVLCPTPSSACLVGTIGGVRARTGAAVNDR